MHPAYRAEETAETGVLSGRPHTHPTRRKPAAKHPAYRAEETAETGALGGRPYTHPTRRKPAAMRPAYGTEQPYGKNGLAAGAPLYAMRRRKACAAGNETDKSRSLDIDLLSQPDYWEIYYQCLSRSRNSSEKDQPGAYCLSFRR